MENAETGKSLGYQKQIKKDASQAPTLKKSCIPDYSSPAAKKLPLLMDALESGNVSDVQLAEQKKHGDIVRLIRKHQQKLKTEAREWEDFLASPEGKPFRQKRRYDTLTSFAKLWWLPLLVLGGGGLLIGFLIDVTLLSVIIGIVSALLVDSVFYLTMARASKYLDDVGTLPELDIHTLREKRKAVLPKKRREGEIPEETADTQPLGSTSTDISPLSSLEKTPESAVSREPEERPRVERPKGQKWIHIKRVMYGLAAFILVVLAVGLFVYRDALEKWYYAQKLTGRGIEVSDKAFLDAVARNDEETVDLFIEAGIPLGARNEEGQTALIIASQKGYENIIRSLVKRDVSALNSFDATKNTPLMAAARQGRENVVKLLLERGANVNYTIPAHEGAASALQAALDTPDFLERHMKTVRYLLDKGADVKGGSSSGRPPIEFAAEYGRADVAKMLLEKGADVSAVDQKGKFALFVAACKGQTDFITLLADNGAKMAMALPDGQTPLMCAARESHLAAAKVLLERGAPVNARAANGSTALAEAAKTGNLDIVKLLLKRGADPGPGSGYLPDSFTALNGKTIDIRGKKGTISDLLKRIAKSAASDGYAVNLEATSSQKPNVTIKASWNRVLTELANRNHLYLLVKNKEVFVLPYNPTTIKHESN